MQWKRVIYYLLINVVVSASTVLIVLTIWERTHNSALEQTVPPIVVPSPGVEMEVSQSIAPTDLPSMALQPHQVQPDETLSEIAQAYGVDVETILQLNGKTDADSLGTGEIIYVPAPTHEPPEATSVSQITQPSGVEIISDGDIKIDSVIGVGDLGTERVVLKNISNGRQSMAGWQLRDNNGHTYVFSQATLYGQGAISLNTRSSVETSLELFWGLSEAAWQVGEVVTLFDAMGKEVDRYQIP